MICNTDILCFFKDETFQSVSILKDYPAVNLSIIPDMVKYRYTLFALYLLKQPITARNGDKISQRHHKLNIIILLDYAVRSPCLPLKNTPPQD